MKKYLKQKEISHLISEFNIETAKKFADGKSKTLFATQNPKVALMEFKPSLRSITYNRKQNIAGTDLERMKACLEIFRYLEQHNIRTQLQHDKIITITHKGEARHLLAVSPSNTIPLEWITRFYAAGSIARLFPTLVKHGQKLTTPLQKYDLKQEADIGGVDDPTLNESYIVGLGLLTASELKECKQKLKRISDLLNKRLQSRGMTLIDLKMEFGKDEQGKIILIDEISQDCMRVNDKEGESITKDSFRQMKSEEDVLRAYQRFSKMISNE